jgi:multidrug efflux pump subunit AcrA (membrane-fusion protein)
MEKKTKKLIIIAGIAVIALILGVIVYRIAAKIIQESKQGRQATYAVGQITLKKQLLEKTLSFRGVLEGDPQVKVYSPVAGKFQSNAVSEGDNVNPDDILTYINRDVVGQTYQPALVRAPVAGMVKKLYFVDRGTPVTVDRPVAEITNQDSIKVVLTVGEEDLSRVKTGMDAVITSLYDENLKIKARVFSVTPFVDSDTFSGSIIIKAENASHTGKIGISVVVNIITGRSDAFLVPANAIGIDLESTFIFVNVDDTAKRVPVRQGYAKGGLIEITGEVKDGDNVVTDGSFKLFNGAKLSVAGEGDQNQRNASGDTGQKPPVKQ